VTSFKIFMFYGGYGLHGRSSHQDEFLMLGPDDRYDIAHFEFIMREAQRLMAKRQKSRIVVIDDEDHLVGVISLADISQEEEPDRVGDTIRHVKENAPQPRPHA